MAKEEYVVDKKLIALVLIILFFVSCIILGNSDNSNNPNEKSSAVLTTEKKQEICNDIQAYTDFCYTSGINSKTCGEQIAEKATRIYEISPTQLKEVLNYCNNQ